MNSSNKNLLQAVAVIFAFLLAWDYFVVKKYQPKPAPSNAIVKTSTPGAAPSFSAATKKIEPTPAKVEQQLHSVLIQADGVQGLIDPYGAGIREWKVFEKDRWVQLVSISTGINKLPFQTGEETFHLVSNDHGQATFEAITADSVRIQKTFHLLKQPPFHQFSIQLQNKSARPVHIAETLQWSEGLLQRVEGQPVKPKEESINIAKSSTFSISWPN